MFVSSSKKMTIYRTFEAMVDIALMIGQQDPTKYFKIDVKCVYSILPQGLLRIRSGVHF